MDDRRSERFVVAVQGRYRTGSGIARDVPILDLSATGCRIFDRFGRLPHGKSLTIKIGPIGPIAAVVAWCKNQVVGVHFERPLYGPVFEHIRDQVNDAHGEQKSDQLMLSRSARAR